GDVQRGQVDTIGNHFSDVHIGRLHRVHETRGAALDTRIRHIHSIATLAAHDGLRVLARGYEIRIVVVPVVRGELESGQRFQIDTEVVIRRILRLQIVT